MSGYPCSRCGGSGRYSFNLIHGTKCYGCNGTGKQKTKPRAPTPKWAVFGHDSATGESRRLYNVTAKTADAAIAKARATYQRASAEFRASNTLANAQALRWDQMTDPSALTLETDPITAYYADRANGAHAAKAP